MSRSTRLHEGYIMIDHRASPGLTDEQATRAGLPVGAGRGLFESATMHCAHCGTVVIINPWRAKSRASCNSCNAYICDRCGAEAKQPGYQHYSYAQMIDEVYNRGAANG
jgi:hypothetical protein